jgi:hypothetical protein
LRENWAFHDFPSAELHREFLLAAGLKLVAEQEKLTKEVSRRPWFAGSATARRGKYDFNLSFPLVPGLAAAADYGIWLGSGMFFNAVTGWNPTVGSVLAAPLYLIATGGILYTGFREDLGKFSIPKFLEKPVPATSKEINENNWLRDFRERD